jgi:hypothetical protein
MNPDELARAAHPKALSAYLVKRPMSMRHDEGGHGKPIQSVRESEHAGHHIVIRTTYQVEIDGRVADLPLGVDNDGHVHCHSLPNYQFNSAIDMVKQVLDTFPRDFSKSGKRGPAAAAAMSDHAGMQMPMRRGKTRGKTRGK